MRLTITLTLLLSTLVDRHDAHAASPPIQMLYRLNAEPEQVRIESVDDAALTFRAATTKDGSPQLGELQTVASDQIVSWGHRRSFRTASQVLLRDGGVLIVDLLDAAPDQWVWGADPLSFGSVRPVFRKVGLPRSLIAGAIFTPPSDPSSRDALAIEIRRSSPDDTWWIERGNQVKGQLLDAKAAVDAGDGLNSENGVTQWVVRVRQRAITLEHSRVESLRLAATTTGQRGSKPRWMLGFLDGSFVLVHGLAERDGVVHLRLAGDAVAQVESDEFYEELCLARPLHPRVFYLTDTKPTEQRHQPFLTVERPARLNQSVLGGLPRHNDFVFSKSLGVASRSFVVYNIPQGWKRLATDVALDRSSKGGGSVVFKVFTQATGASPWKVAASTDTVLSGHFPKALSVPLEDVSRVALMVDYADNGDVLDYANWLNLRLEK